MPFLTKVEPVTAGDVTISYAVRCVLAGTDTPCFTSTGWETKKLANARAREHHGEHKGNGLARELEAFRSGVSQEDYDAKIAERVKAALKARDTLEEA
jgi:hypothetical protein